MDKKTQLESRNLLLQRPDIAKQWDYKCNRELRPEDVFVNSHKKVWWKCYRGHFWEARINDRTRKDRGTNCPYCAKKRKWKK